MSEVALVAAITGGTSVLTSAITAAVTWAVSQNSSAVELAKVAAENERLQQENQEEERRNRQSTYHQFIDSFNEIFATLGIPFEQEPLNEKFKTFNHLVSGVLIFGSPDVRTATYRLTDVYGRLFSAMREEIEKNPEKSFEDCWCDATAPLKEEFSAVGSKIVPLMHADVTRGITGSPTVEEEGAST